MTVKAKFNCWSVIEPNTSNENRVIEMHPVTSGSEENKSFAKYTPAGVLILDINPETPAYNFFEAGKDYYLTIEAAE